MKLVQMRATLYGTHSGFERALARIAPDRANRRVPGLHARPRRSYGSDCPPALDRICDCLRPRRRVDREGAAEYTGLLESDPVLSCPILGAAAGTGRSASQQGAWIDRRPRRLALSTDQSGTWVIFHVERAPGHAPLAQPGRNGRRHRQFLVRKRTSARARPQVGMAGQAMAKR